MIVPFSLRENYWEDFEILEADIEFLYSHLLEQETPLTPLELVTALIELRIHLSKKSFEENRVSGDEVFMPKNDYLAQQTLVFPAYGWQRGKVVQIRKGWNPDDGDFQVMKVLFEDGAIREIAFRISQHILNEPLKIDTSDPSLDPEQVLNQHEETLVHTLEDALYDQPGFVRIAGRWFPRALLVDINVGHLNLAEAVLDMTGGGPLRTASLIEQIGIKSDLNQKLLDFSLDMALQEDPRFDEVGPAGETLWFLNRLEPPQVLEPPIYLRYSGIDYDRSLLSNSMLELERSLDDELSPINARYTNLTEVNVPLIFPHLRAGSLPLSARVRHLFPTAYEAPRIRFMLVDGQTGEKFPGWVVREKRYVYGLGEWYKSHYLIPGSIVRVQRGQVPGEVIVRAESRRPTRDWMRTVLVGSDGGVVYAMLKQPISGTYDERMGISIPDPEALDEVWLRLQKDHTPFERIVVNTVRELARLNPQSHVHASELYAAINVIRRVPPGPILALLASRPWFIHVGDLHYRFSDLESN